MKSFEAVDLFCGAGGTSTGLIQAGKSLGININLTAIDHWDRAIETHKKNHPKIRHLCENLDNVNPRKLFPSGRIKLLIASPECTHHSNARGGTTCSDQSRATAWRIVDWAAALYIDNILIENVPEFESWGPLGVNGRPMESKKGETFQAFKIALRSLGYRVEHRVLNAADYGDPTCRKRLFLIARRGNKKIKFPEITHTHDSSPSLFGETKQWIPVKDIIDWSIHGQSIFDRKKPLAEKTMARIEYGLKKFGDEEFSVKYFGTGKGVSVNKPLPTVTATGENISLCEPLLIRFHGGKGSEKRVHDIEEPIPVVDTSNRYGLVEPFILPQQAGRKNQLRVKSINQPLTTITTTGSEMLVEPFLVGIDNANAEKKNVRSLDKPAPTVITQQNYVLVQAFLLQYYGRSKAKSIDKPLGTVTTKDRFGLIELFKSAPGLDIRLRMMQPHELAAAQSFPKNYKFAGNKGEVVKQIGNAVPIKMAKALCMELIN